MDDYFPELFNEELAITNAIYRSTANVLRSYKTGKDESDETLKETECRTLPKKARNQHNSQR